MDPAGGVKSVENLRAAGNKQARTCIVPGAGHHGARIPVTPLLSVANADYCEQFT
jgi:hypothetical protein